MITKKDMTKKMRDAVQQYVKECNSYSCVRPLMTFHKACSLLTYAKSARDVLAATWCCDDTLPQHELDAVFELSLVTDMICYDDGILYTEW